VSEVTPNKLVDMAATFTLDSAVEAHAEFSAIFSIPSAHDRQNLGEGDLAKLMFRIRDGDREFVERMWVRVKEVRPSGYNGILDNDPQGTNALRSGMAIEFTADHVIQIWRDAS
jgi:uncharacterized protein YegJ (DUF2314 family)